MSPHRFFRWLLVSLVIGGMVMALAGEWTSLYLWGFTLGLSGVFLYATLLFWMTISHESGFGRRRKAPMPWR